MDVAKAIDAIPVVASATERGLLFPAPAMNQRVFNLTTNAVERWNGVTWIIDFGRTVLLPEQFGAKGDAVTDDTAAVNALLAQLYANNGGTGLFDPSKTYLCLGQIVVPNNGAALPKQPPMRLTSTGATTHAGQTGTPVGGATLDLRYAGAVAKIDTRGLGGFELDHLTLVDRSAVANTTPFFQTTNTTVFLHHNRVQGHVSKAGVTCDQDAFVCGGTRSSGVLMNGDSDSCFQGYGSVISENCFSKIRRGVYGRTAFNANTIEKNWFLHDCGSNLAGGAAIELLGIAADGSAGNNVCFNTIEVGAYPYGIKAQYSVLGTYIGNGMYDPTVTHLAGVRFEANATRNMVIDGFRVDTYPGISDANNPSVNTFITSHQQQESIIPEPQRWTNASGSKFVNGTGQGPITEAAAGDQWYNLMLGGNDHWYYIYKPNAGASEQQVYFWRVDANTRQLVFIGNGSHAIKSDLGHILIDCLTAGKRVTIGNTGAGILGTTLAGFYGSNGVAKPTITGIRSGNAGLQALLAALVTQAQLVNSTTSGGVTITYSAAMTIDSATTDIATITATDGVAFTINAPTNPVAQARLRVRIRNTSGGALGVATWNAVFKMRAWVQPATANSRTIDFDYDGTNWVEAHRTEADVPN